MIDPQVLCPNPPVAGVYTYYMFYKNETTKFIEVLIGTSSTGVENVTNWAVAESGNWAGWSNNLEAPNVTKIGNNWNILLDAEGSGIYYSTAPVSGGLLGTWSPKALISSPSTMQHGMLLPATSRIWKWHAIKRLGTALRCLRRALNVADVHFRNGI